VTTQHGVCDAHHAYIVAVGSSHTNAEQLVAHSGRGVTDGPSEGLACTVQTGVIHVLTQAHPREAVIIGCLIHVQRINTEMSTSRN